MANKIISEILPDSLKIRFTSVPPSRKIMHVHPYYEIVFSLTDSLYIKFGTNLVHMPSGSLVLVNPMDLHRYFSTSDSCARYSLYFFPDILMGMNSYETNLFEYFHNRSGNYPQVLSPVNQDGNTIETLFRRLEYSYNSKDLVQYGKKLNEILILTELLLSINNRYRKIHGITGCQSTKVSNLIYEAIHYIQMHYSENINVNSIAAFFFTSKSNLNRLFHRLLNKSVYQYIEEYRITKAKEFLLSGYSIEICGQMIGYNNRSYFSRFFKNHTSMSPKKYQLTVEG
jgi:YesN/AraC family two-component response regulator